MTTWAFPFAQTTVAISVWYRGSPAFLTDKSDPGTGLVTYNVRSGSGTGPIVGQYTLDGTGHLDGQIKNTSGATAIFGHSLTLTLPDTISGTAAPVKMLDKYGSVPYASRGSWHYPYNFELPYENSVNLAAPGFLYDGYYVIAQTTELTRIDAQHVGSNYVMTMWRGVIQNIGHDALDFQISIANGATDYFPILASGSMKTIFNTIFGTPNTVPAWRWAEIENNGWDVYGAPGLMTSAEWTQICTAMAGKIDAIVARGAAPQSYIATACHAAGIKVFFYMSAAPGIQYTATPPTTDADGAGVEVIDNGTWTGNYLLDSNGDQIESGCDRWQLMDIRGSGAGTAHDKFVAIAQGAMNAGYDGIHFDHAYLFFAGTDGFVGGDVPGATQSLEGARIKLIQDVKAACIAINPAALIVCTGNYPYAGLHVYDLTFKEALDEAWGQIDENPFENWTMNQDLYGAQWVADWQPYCQNHLTIGHKGLSPLLCRTAFKNWLGTPTGDYYVEVGDAASTPGYANCLTAIGILLGGISTYDASSTHGTDITANSTDQVIACLGSSVVSVKNPTTLTFSQETACLFLGDPIGGASHTVMIANDTLAMVANGLYIAAERNYNATSGWCHSGYGFCVADLASSYWIEGDFHNWAPPTGGTVHGTPMVFSVMVVPGPLTTGNSTQHGGYFTARTIETHFATTPVSWSIWDKTGTTNLSGNQTPASGVFSVNLGATIGTLTPADWTEYQLQVAW